MWSSGPRKCPGGRFCTIRSPLTHRRLGHVCRKPRRSNVVHACGRSVFSHWRRCGFNPLVTLSLRTQTQTPRWLWENLALTWVTQAPSLDISWLVLKTAGMSVVYMHKPNCSLKLHHKLYYNLQRRYLDRYEISFQLMMLMLMSKLNSLG